MSTRPLSSVGQKPPAWYALVPLRGSGKNGGFIDEDFLSALFISKPVFQEARNSAIRILDEQAEDSSSKIDLRSIWKRWDGAQTKEKMLQRLISENSEIFSNTCRLQHIPPNWDTVKWMLAELFMLSANASRGRQLYRTNANARANPSAASTPSTASSIAGVAATQELQQAWSNGPHFLLTNLIILNNVIVPVVYGDLRVDILPDQFRRSGKVDKPQFVDDISLDRLVNVLGRKFQTDHVLQVWGMNSMGSFIELEDDHHLQIALIVFVQFGWPCREKPPGLEVRPRRQSASP